MTTLEVPVHFDFASSICYVAYRAMQRLDDHLSELEVCLHWTPVDLTQITGVRRGATMKPEAQANALRVAEELEVELRLPEAWIDSRLVHGAAIALEGSGRESAFLEGVFTSHFESGVALDDGASLTTVLREVGASIPPEDFDEALEELDRRTRQAQTDLVTGVPTFMLGSWAFGGIQSDETMRLIFERFASRARRGLLM